MTALLAPSAKQQFFTNAGAPAAGYRVYTYAANTTTPQATYTNRAGTVANANPIILDSRGEAVIYLTPGVVYDFTLKTDTDALVWTREDVTADAGDANAILYTASGTSTVERTAQEKLDEWKSVKDFGAVGDGSTDDTTALQTAITRAAADGFDLLFPDGTYKVTSTLTQTGTLVMGALSKYGRVTITKATAGDLFQGASAVITNLAFTHTGTSGKILDLTGDGARAEGCSFTNASGNASDMVHCTRSDHYFGRNYFTNNEPTAYCIHVERTAAGNCINGAIDNHNTFAGTGRGIKFTSSSAGARPEGWSVEGNVLILTGATSIRVEAVLHLSIVRNIIDQASVYGIDVAPGSENIDSLLIEGNYIAASSAPTTGFAVETDNGAGSIFNLRICDNHVEQSGFGVVLRESVADFTVTGNTFANINVAGTSLSYNGANKGVIANNVFRGSNIHLALIDGATGVSVAVIGNVFPSTGSVSATFTDRTRFDFRGNVGKKFDGWSSVQLAGASGTGAAFTCPHGLAVTPDRNKVVGVGVMESGNYSNVAVRVDAVDATNITGALHYTTAVVGNLRVNLYASA